MERERHSTEPASAVELQPKSNVNTEPETSLPPLADQYPSGLRFVLLTVGLILSIFLSALDQSIIATAIPRITDQFGTVKDVGWYGSGYAITNAAFQSTWGKAVCHFTETFGKSKSLADTFCPSTNTSRSNGPSC